MLNTEHYFRHCTHVIDACLVLYISNTYIIVWFSQYLSCAKFYKSFLLDIDNGVMISYNDSLDLRDYKFSSFHAARYSITLDIAIVTSNNIVIQWMVKPLMSLILRMIRSFLELPPFVIVKVLFTNLEMERVFHTPMEPSALSLVME